MAAPLGHFGVNPQTISLIFNLFLVIDSSFHVLLSSFILSSLNFLLRFFISYSLYPTYPILPAPPLFLLILPLLSPLLFPFAVLAWFLFFPWC